MATELQNPISDEPRNKTLETPLTGTMHVPPPPTATTAGEAAEPESTAPKDAEDPAEEAGSLSRSPPPVPEATPEPVSDLQKKALRAERFGMTVQISEEEKRSSRAERFGTASPKPRPDAEKSEEQKRKARAERFGLGTDSAVDEEAKKKARSTRFTVVSNTDPLEEDKRKARAIRFSQAKSGDPSQQNGEANT
ncbi:hypothetical protein QJS10_CPB20g00713 [Acorus calamus]|uniref:THO1-MOS11 C-terminal domain-containing protein n=1 Tax=Acorus calamus TaxID=4465 RepID=A0AAV9C976_ACOCL|nr:hypothetical protein QJS10_CPB20g00713 [Acorus calamus]